MTPQLPLPKMISLDPAYLLKFTAFAFGVEDCLLKKTKQKCDKVIMTFPCSGAHSECASAHMPESVLISTSTLPTLLYPLTCPMALPQSLPHFSPQLHPSLFASMPSAETHRLYLPPSMPSSH